MIVVAGGVGQVRTALMRRGATTGTGTLTRARKNDFG